MKTIYAIVDEYSANVYLWSFEEQAETADSSSIIVIGALEPTYLFILRNRDFLLIISIPTPKL